MGAPIASPSVLIFETRTRIEHSIRVFQSRAFIFVCVHQRWARRPSWNQGLISHRKKQSSRVHVAFHTLCTGPESRRLLTGQTSCQVLYHYKNVSVPATFYTGVVSAVINLPVSKTAEETTERAWAKSFSGPLARRVESILPTISTHSSTNKGKKDRRSFLPKYESITTI